MPGLSGLDLQDSLARAGRDLPIVFISGHGDIPTTVQAMKAGAVSFLPKPFTKQRVSRGDRGRARAQPRARAARSENAQLQACYRSLTPREREVFALVAAGLLNKLIADRLGAAETTIKIHRGRVMEKMGAASRRGPGADGRAPEPALACIGAGLKPAGLPAAKRRAPSPPEAHGVMRGASPQRMRFPVTPRSYFPLRRGGEYLRACRQPDLGACVCCSWTMTSRCGARSQRAIRLAGFEVEAFKSVEALAARGISDHDACLVLDVDLPGLGGIAFKRMLAQAGRDLPTIFITALEPGEVSEPLAALGPVALLYKPFNTKDLLEAIGRTQATKAVNPGANP